MISQESKRALYDRNLWPNLSNSDSLSTNYIFLII